MIEQLFGSKTRAKLLHLFLSNPNRSFYVREITRKIDEQINSVRRELANLLSMGIITSDTTDNRLYYEVNQSYQYYEPLAEIFGGKKRKVTAPAASKEKKKKSDEVVLQDVPVDTTHPLVAALTGYGAVDVVVLSGKFTRDETSGVDVLVVGNIAPSSFEKVMDDFEKSEGKELLYAQFTLDEFQYRLQVNDKFISNIIFAKKQVLLDTTGRIK
jgi:predicted transcriptional regulator